MPKSDEPSADRTYPTVASLRAFVEMARVVKKYGLFKLLKKNTGLTRQGISKHRERLEEYYGVSLLRETEVPGIYEVTPEGDLLCEYAKRVLRAHKLVKAWPPGGSKAGRIVRIGCGNAVMRYFLPEHTVRLLNEAGPDPISVRIVESQSSERMLRDLRLGKIHIGIEGVLADDDGQKRRPRSSPYKELEYSVLREEQLYSTIAVGHEGSLPQGASPLTLAEIASRSESVPLYFVAGQEVEVLRRLRSLRKDYPNVARRVAVMSTLDAVLACVRKGPGIGFVSAFLKDEVKKPKRGLVVRSLEVDLEGLFERLYLGVWWRKADIERRKNQPEEMKKRDPVLMLLRFLKVELR